MPRASFFLRRQTEPTHAFYLPYGKKGQKHKVAFAFSTSAKRNLKRYCDSWHGIHPPAEIFGELCSTLERARTRYLRRSADEET